MKEQLSQLFESRVSGRSVKPLFIFEMANNHMGDVDHGLKIIREMHKVSKDFDFLFAVKFQYRDLNTFIHPDFKQRMDIKYIKRFSDTHLTEEQFLTLKAEADKLGFISMCTPFDENSVDLAVKHNYDILKIASASNCDWPLLEKIVQADKPIIFSTGGASLENIDAMVSFFQHRAKKFAIEHCVGEYPTLTEHLQLNQLDLFKNRYPDVAVGYSTHETPDNYEAVKLAVAKGAVIFEKHVAVQTEKYEINSYSAAPEQVKLWLSAARDALVMCGVAGERAEFSSKELADLRQFRRGVFAREDINKGDKIDVNNTFFAFPNQPNQILANEMSKYTIFIAQEGVKKNQPIIEVAKSETRGKVYEIVLKIRDFLAKTGIPVSNQLDFEISHHYGIDKFYEYGAVIITCVNREYAKKLIVMLPGQKHPAHTHKVKEETFHVLYGNFVFELDGKEKPAKAGDIIVVERGMKHAFSTQNGGVFEEVSTTHKGSGDSYYEDEDVGKNTNRKTHLTYWLE